MNDASRGTLFKRREVAESVKAHLGKGVALVKFTVKGGRLKRLSPFRGMRLRTSERQPNPPSHRTRTQHAQMNPSGWPFTSKRSNLSGQRVQAMKLNYYADTDSLYIDLSERTSVESREISTGVVLDYDAEGNLVGIDIDNASRKVDLKKLTLNKLPAIIQSNPT